MAQVPQPEARATTEGDVTIPRELSERMQMTPDGGATLREIARQDQAQEAAYQASIEQQAQARVVQEIQRVTEPVMAIATAIRKALQGFVQSYVHALHTRPADGFGLNRQRGEQIPVGDLLKLNTKATLHLEKYLDQTPPIDQVRLMSRATAQEMQQQMEQFSLFLTRRTSAEGTIPNRDLPEVVEFAMGLRTAMANQIQRIGALRVGIMQQEGEES